MQTYWSKYQESAAAALGRTVITDDAGRVLEPDAGFERLCEMSRTLRSAGGTMHFAGNGASACMASHMALDWVKNGGVRATAYNDSANLTAIGNDLGYDQAFAAPISWYARKGDMLVTISSSGNSGNVVQALRVAREMGVKTVTLSGMKPDNRSRQAGDVNLYVPSWSYGIVECAHQILLHTWLDRYMDVKEWELSVPQIVLPPTR